MCQWKPLGHQPVSWVRAWPGCPGAAGPVTCPGQKALGKAERRAGRRWHCVTVVELQGKAGDSVAVLYACLWTCERGPLLKAAEPGPALLGQ